MTTPKFAHVDVSKPDGFYVQMARKVLDDCSADPMDFLFQDEDYRAEDQARLDAFRNDEWRFVGIRAEARCLIVRSGVGTMMTLESAGLWGIESDSGEDYFAEVYGEEKAALLATIRAMTDPIVEEVAA